MILACGPRRRGGGASDSGEEGRDVVREREALEAVVEAFGAGGRLGGVVQCGLAGVL